MIYKNEKPLQTLEQWKTHAGPKRIYQWKDGRSAKEAARAWLEASPEVPPEIRDLLVSHRDFGELSSWRAEPEARVSFDSFGGEPANVDVLLLGEDSSGTFVAAVEAKADEPFGSTLADTLTAARERLASNPRSRGVDRIDQLVEAFFGADSPELEEGEQVRYQLLTASAAALSKAEAHGMSRAVLIVHEFVTDLTSDEKHRANGRDLELFLEMLSDRAADSAGPPSDAGERPALVGPFSIAGTPLWDDPARLYVGKARRVLRT